MTPFANAQLSALLNSAPSSVADVSAKSSVLQLAAPGGEIKVSVVS